jgi:uncharacterized protein (DUF169 family)
VLSRVVPFSRLQGRLTLGTSEVLVKFFLKKKEKKEKKRKKKKKKTFEKDNEY